jgi:hypothetical protein
MGENLIMNKTHYYCDICKKEFENTELVSLTIEMKYRKDWAHTYQQYDLCNSCCEKLGFKKQEVVNQQSEQKTTAEQLYEILAQIVYENQQG